MRTKTTTVYTFTELSDTAKEKARQWFRESNTDTDFDCTLDDAETVAGLLGIEIRKRSVPLMNGKTRDKPCIWFSYFCSQGDGACFDGYWKYKAGMQKAIREHAPQDTELHRIAQQLTAAARQSFYTATATVTHSGRYYHSGTMTVDVSSEKGPDVSDDITQALREFADWIYSQLENEYEYQNSDAAVDESIAANEYEFTEAGEIA
jgi:hypothetical protein